MKAEGGWAAVFTEFCSISPESDDSHRMSARIWDDGDIRNLSLMCDALHEHGSLAGIELWYGGPHAPNRSRAAGARGASQIPSDIESLTNASEVDKDEIRDVQSCTSTRQSGPARPGSTSSTSTARTRYLPQQFLTPSTTSAPTSTAARSRTASASRARRSRGQGGRRRRLRDRDPLRRIDTLVSRRPATAASSDDGQAVHRSSRPPRRLLGPQRRHAELGRGRRSVAVLRAEPRGRRGRRRPRGDSHEAGASTSAASPTPT